MFKKVLGVILLLMILLFIYLQRDFPKQESLIFYNGKIITMEDDQPTTQAVFVKDGVIQSIGTQEDIFSLKKKNTKMINLQGKTLMPGFIDPHTHLAISTFLHSMLDLSGFTHDTPEQLWNHLQQHISKTPKGEWIICKGLDPILVKGLEVPHISFLDSIAPQNPVIILAQSLHSYWANTKGFAKVGIDKNTPDPTASSFYEKDVDGNLTGFIAEQEAFKPFVEAFEKIFTPDLMIKATTQVLEDYAKKGNTTIVSTGLSIQDGKPLQLYEHLSAGKPKSLNQLLTLLGFFPNRKSTVRHFIYHRHDRVNLLPVSPKNGDDHYRILGVKHWYDGSPYTGSMFLDEPYQISELTKKGLHIPEGGRGKRLVEKSDMVNFIEKYQSQGWQIAVHTQGDAAINETIEAFEVVNKNNNLTNSRHRLEHCLLLPNEAIEKLAALNMTPSIHINHLLYYGDALKNDIIGEARSNKTLPLNSIQKHGLKFSLHADQPMFESHPLRLIQTAVERKTKEGEVLGADEKLNIMEALKANTIYAAWQIKMENKLGSIKVGKYADLIILDKNPLEVPYEELENIKVLDAFVSGNEVF